MNPELIAYIQDAIKNNVSLYQVRTDLLAAGWTAELVDSHIRFVRENPAVAPAAAASAAAPAAAGVAAKTGGFKPGCGLMILIGIVPLVLSIMTEGVLSQVFFSIVLLLFWVWVIFWGGDARLEGSMLMGFITIFPGATQWRREGIRLVAWVSLLGAVGGIIFNVYAASQPRWDPFVWPDQQTRTLMGSNRAYWYEKSFSSSEECRKWLLENLTGKPEAVSACGLNCRQAGIRLECKELR